MTNWIDGLEDEKSTLEGLISERRDEGSPSARLGLASLVGRLEEVNGLLTLSSRPNLRVRLRGSAVSGHEVKLDTLGPLLDELQETISSIGQALRGSPTASSSIPSDVRAETSMSIDALEPGSVILNIRAPADPRITDPPLTPEFETRSEPLAVAAIERLMGLTQLAKAQEEDDDALVEAIFPLGPRTYRHLYDLIKVLIDSEIEADMDLLSPVEGPQSAHLGLAAARRLRDVLRRTQIAVESKE